MQLQLVYLLITYQMFRYLKIILFFLIFSCVAPGKIYDQNGFASLSKNNLIISKLPSGTLVRVVNHQNNKSIVIRTSAQSPKLSSRIIFIPKKIYKKINLNEDLPFVRVISLRENKKFIAKKAKTYEEEKRVKGKINFNKVEIVNLNDNSDNEKKIYINYGPFYFQTYADGLYKILTLNLKNTKILFKDYKPKKHIISIGPIRNLKEYDELHKNLGALGLIGYEVKIK